MAVSIFNQLSVLRRQKPYAPPFISPSCEEGLLTGMVQKNGGGGQEQLKILLHRSFPSSTRDEHPGCISAQTWRNWPVGNINLSYHWEDQERLLPYSKAERNPAQSLRCYVALW